MAGQGLPIEGDLLNLGIGATTRKVPLRHLDFPMVGSARKECKKACPLFLLPSEILEIYNFCKSISLTVTVQITIFCTPKVSNQVSCYFC